ncbi:MAG: type I secretion system permease/ATPase [Pseudomonadota bacterium]
MTGSITPPSSVENTLDTGLHCLVILAQILDTPASLESLQREFSQPNQHFSDVDILRAAKSLSLKAKRFHCKTDDLNQHLLPAIAELNDGSFVIIGKNIFQENEDANHQETNKSSTHYLLQDPRQQKPQIVNQEELLKKWTGKLLLFSNKQGYFKSKAAKFDISWFIPVFKKYKKQFYEVFIASFFLQIFALVLPLFFQVVMDKVLLHNGLTTLDVLTIAFVSIILFDVFLEGFRTYLFSHTTNRVDVELGTKLFTHLLGLPLAYFENRPVGHSVARVKELDSIRNFITGSALTLVIDLLFTLVFFSVMWFYSPYLTVIVLLTIPFYIVLSIVITPILRKRLDEKFKYGAQNQAFLVESVTGVQTVKALALEPNMRRTWENQLADYVKSSFKTQHLGNIASQIAAFINKLTTILIIYFGAQLVMSGELSVGQLIAFNMIAGRVSNPILKLVQLWQDFQQAAISVARLGDILNTPTEQTYDPNRTTLSEIKGDVTLDDVVFRYRPDAQPILNHVSLAVKAGEVTGIVGRSGSGKSTLTKLIQRLYTPESGRILIDGVDLASVDTGWLRQHVGVVLQENFLFNRSVRDNIAMTAPSASMDEIINVAKLAGAHDFISELDAGYDTTVGESGCQLSGGQRQRIAIARALLTNPKILIFDEATSALDYESERIIQNNMEEICRGRSVFIIAHRLSTVRRCHRIIVMEKGKIVESGPHNALLKKQGHYARLYALQNGNVYGEHPPRRVIIKPNTPPQKSSQS